MSIYRLTDKETSRLAGDEIAPKLSGLQARFVAMVRHWWGNTGTWPTAQEASAGNESLRKRAAECVRLGFLEEGPVRTCCVTGRKATTYKEAGK